jgi:hypothetical protein
MPRYSDATRKVAARYMRRGNRRIRSNQPLELTEEQVEAFFQQMNRLCDGRGQQHPVPAHIAEFRALLSRARR